MRRPTLRSIFNAKAPKRRVRLSLNEDVLARARDVTNDLSELIESLLADYVALERARRAAYAAATREAVKIWNSLDERHGCFVDEHSTL